MEYNERPFTHFFLDFICNHSTSGLWKKDVALCTGNETPNSLAQGQSQITCRAVSVWLQLDILDLFQFFVCLQRQGQVRWLTFISATKNYSDVKTKNVGSRISWEWLRPRQDFAIRLPKWEPIYVCVSWKFNLIKDFKPVANLQSFRNFNIVPHAISIFLHFFKWDKRNQFLNF